MTTVQKGSVALAVALMAVTAGAALQEEDPGWCTSNRFWFLTQDISFVDKCEVISNRPAFRDLLPRLIIRPRQTPEGKWGFPLSQLRLPKNPDGTPKPFWIYDRKLGEAKMEVEAKLEKQARETWRTLYEIQLTYLVSVDREVEDLLLSIYDIYDVLLHYRSNLMKNT